MFRLLKVASVCFAASLELCFAASLNYGDFKSVELIRVIDGDSVVFNIRQVHPLLGDKISVRLRGVDTPEMRTKDRCEKSKAIIAKKVVESILSSATRIDLIDVGRPKFFRILADIRADGIDVADYLIGKGLAYPYFGGTKKKIDWCKKGNK